MIDSVLPPQRDIDEWLATISWPMTGEPVGPPDLRKSAEQRARAVAWIACQAKVDAEAAWYLKWEPYDVPDYAMRAMSFGRPLPSHLDYMDDGQFSRCFRVTKGTAATVRAAVERR